MAGCQTTAHTVSQDNAQPSIDRAASITEKSQTLSLANARRVAVFIPCYRDRVATEACLASVVSTVATTRHNYEVWVTDDASPEPELTRWLREWSTHQNQSQVSLNTHADNLGFVRSVNEAIARAVDDDRDLLILNSDTVVFGDWLDRMLAHLDKQAGLVASVCASSNNATILSYPAFPEGSSNSIDAVREQDALAAKANPKRAVEVPVGVGFCMLMSNTALKRVGAFDAGAFGRGYGEEVDWCMRAADLGMQHLQAMDVLVYHAGETSFGDSGKPLRTAAQKIIDERYPHFGKAVANHIARDPARTYRRQLDLARLTTSAKHNMLFISHAWGGGVAKHTNDLVTLLAHDCNVLMLNPYWGSLVQLRWINTGESFEAWFDSSKQDEWGSLIHTLKAARTDRVHFHHLHGMPQSACALPAALSVPYDITLHDYAMLSPAYHLSENGQYRDGWQQLEAPATTRPDEARWAMTAGQWRTFFKPFVDGAARVFAASQDTMDRFRSAYPQAHYELLPHPEAAPAVVATRTKVLVLGSLSPEKGMKPVYEISRLVAQSKAPVTIHIIGALASPPPTESASVLSFHGAYDGDQALAQLIADARADVIWMPSQVPETFSYTLTIALASGLPIVASKLGAIGERLANAPIATLLAFDVQPNAWLESLTKAAKQANRLTTGTVEINSFAAYRSTYLKAFSATAPTAPKQPSINASHYYAPAQGVKPEPTLTELFAAGVECGHAQAKQSLGLRLPYVENDLVQYPKTIDELKRYLDSLKADVTRGERELRDFAIAHEKVVTDLNAEVERTRGHVRHYKNETEQLLNSASWKVTRPLRSLSYRSRQLVRRVRNVRGEMQMLRGRMGIVRSIWKNEGTVAVMKRVYQRLTRAKGKPAEPTANYMVAQSVEALHIPTSDTPKVTILIPCYEQALHTFGCLQSIAEHADAAFPFEVIIADDCSPTSLETSLAGVTGVRFVRHSQNLRFLRNVNEAAKHARGEYLVLLNNDTMVTAGWLNALLDPYQKFDRVGAVGAKLIYPDGVLQEAGGIIWKDGSAWNYGRGQDAALPEFNYVREVDYCSAAALLLRTDLWRELGGFDDQLAPAYCEDSDLCQTIAAKGLRVVYQPHATVVHFEGVSHGTDTASGLKAYQVENQRKLVAKWSSRWQGHRANGVRPELERDRGVTKRLLYVDATMLRPDQDSGSVRSSRILKLARKMGWRVTFMPDNLEFDAKYNRDLQAHGIETPYWPQCTGVTGFLEQHAAEYDLIILSRYYIAKKHIETVREVAPNVRVALDTHDLHFVRARRLAALEGDTALAKDAASVYAEEMGVLSSCDEVLVVSPMEKELLAEHLPGKTVTVLTNVHDTATDVPPFSERDGFMFVGGYRHPPNVDAVLWYAKDVHPLVQQKRPGLTVRIVGSNPPDVFKPFASDTFILQGFVDDLTPLLSSMRLSIAPLRYGAGVKGKINQSMAHGLPVVGTVCAVEGMHLRDGEEVLVADDAQAFADAIIRLHDDEAIWNRLSKASLQNVVDHFSEAVAERELLGMMKRADEHA